MAQQATGPRGRATRAGTPNALHGGPLQSRVDQPAMFHRWLKPNSRGRDVAETLRWVYNTTPILQDVMVSKPRPTMPLLREATVILTALARAVDRELARDDPQRIAHPFTPILTTFLFAINSPYEKPQCQAVLVSLLRQYCHEQKQDTNDWNKKYKSRDTTKRDHPMAKPWVGMKFPTYIFFSRRIWALVLLVSLPLSAGYLNPRTTSIIFSAGCHKKRISLQNTRAFAGSKNERTNICRGVFPSIIFFLPRIIGE